MFRAQVDTLVRRLQEPRRFLQVLAGPRQVGKSTIARQALDRVGCPGVYASADGPAPPGPAWIDARWDEALRLADNSGMGAVLVLDEVQKIPRWAELLKARWDADSHHGRALRVVVVASTPLLVQTGLTESLAGRFELIRVPHWAWPEMREAFGWNVDQYVLFGGYPGGAPLVDEPTRWSQYVRDALVETTVSRDVLLMTRVDKPALLRQLFDLASAYSARELSYTKMLGQLQDAGNTTTLAHYLELLAGAGLVAALPRYTGDVARRRASSPKLCVYNTALATAQLGDPRPFRDDPAAWGRLVESCVGAHLLNTAAGDGIAVSWWREGNHQVDFVLHRGGLVTAIEVKSGFADASRGLDAFRRQYPRARALVVGPTGTPLEEVLSRPASAWLS